MQEQIQLRASVNQYYRSSAREELLIQSLLFHTFPIWNDYIVIARNEAISRFGRFYSVSQSIKVHLETSPLTPLLIKERGDKVQLFRGEVIAVLQLLDKRYNRLLTHIIKSKRRSIATSLHR